MAVTDNLDSTFACSRHGEIGKGYLFVGYTDENGDEVNNRFCAICFSDMLIQHNITLVSPSSVIDKDNTAIVGTPISIKNHVQSKILGKVVTAPYNPLSK